MTHNNNNIIMYPFSHRGTKPTGKRGFFMTYYVRVLLYGRIYHI